VFHIISVYTQGCVCHLFAISAEMYFIEIENGVE